MSVSAINPLCSPLTYECKYGDYRCQSSCGEYLSPLVTTPPTTTLVTETTTPYIECDENDETCTTPSPTTTVTTTTTTSTTTTTTVCSTDPEKVFSISILNQETGEPIADASINISSIAGYTSTVSAQHKTNIDGKVTDSLLAAELLELIISASGFMTVVAVIDVNCKNINCQDCYQDFIEYLEPVTEVTENPVDPDDTTKSIEDACPEAVGQILVEDEVTGKAISGALVNVFVKTASDNDTEEIVVVQNMTSNENGLIEVPLTVNGDYSITVSHDLYDDMIVDEVVDCHVEDCSLCSLNITASLKRDNTTVCENVEMKVHIRDELDRPVEGATVNIFISGQEVALNDDTLVTDATGEVVVEIPETGEFMVDVEAPGRIPLRANKNVSCDPLDCGSCHPVIKFTVEEEPTATEPPMCNDQEQVMMDIRIFDALTELPVDSARVSVTLVPEDDHDHEAEEHGEHVIACGVEADHEGYLSLEIIENGSYTALVTAAGYLNSTKTVTVSCDPDDCGNCSARMDLALDQDFCASTVFTVEVVDESTTLPVEGASVKVSVKSGNKTRPVSKNLVCKPGVTEARQVNDCGYYGIKKNECLKRGCCWDDSIDDINYCYFMEEEGDMLTDENGIVSMPVSGKGDYKVKIKKRGFKDSEAENEVSCPVESGCDECRPMLRMSVPQDFCNNSLQLKIHVVDDHQNPIESVQVDLILSESNAGASSTNVGGELITDVNGYVSPFVHDSGTYMISVDHPGFGAKSIETIVTNTSCVDQEIPILITLQENGPSDPTLPPLCPNMQMLVTVRDNVTNATVPGASVSIKSGTKEVAEDVLTDQNGQVEIPISMNGDYEIIVSKEKYLQAEESKMISCTYENQCQCDTSVDITLDQPRCDEDIPMILPVTVRDNITNTPVPNSLATLVLVSSLSGSSQIEVEEPKYTNDDGYVNFTVPVNGEYSLHVSADGYVLKETSVDVNCDPTHCEACILSAPIKLNEEFCEDKFLEMVIRNSLNNSIVQDVKVVVTLETYTGPREVINEEVEEGTVHVPLSSNGVYTSKVSKPGYVTLERMFEVDVSMDQCNLFDPVEMTPLPPTPPPSCVRLSLSWGPQPQDLDLYSYRVNNNNSTDQCLTFFCDGKDPCNGTVFDIDSKNGGLNGSETITYCETEDFSNMVYVDDLSGKGSSLLGSQARLTITGSGRSEEFVLDPSAASDDENSRYWLAGCLSTTNDGKFDFTQVNKFTADEPSLEEPLNCHNRMRLNAAKSSYTQKLTNSYAEVLVKDAESGLALSDSMVTLSTSKSSYSLLTKEDGKTRIPIK